MHSSCPSSSKQLHGGNVGSLDYHPLELEIARDKDDLRMSLPEVLETDRVILDIGCGIGQSLIALGHFDRKCIGLDVDQAAINYGRENF